jgi:hypothetical protein
MSQDIDITQKSTKAATRRFAVAPMMDCANYARNELTLLSYPISKISTVALP